MKLILDIPIPLYPKLSQYSDAEMVILNLLNKESYAKKFSERTKYKVGKGTYIKERWLGYMKQPGYPNIETPEIIEAIYICHPDYVVSAQSTDPRKNIIKVEKLKSEIEKRGLTTKIVSVWAGTIWEIEILKHLSHTIGMPHTVFRGFAEKEIDLSSCHFFGYKYKEELDKYNPISLSTSIPIRASALGVTLIGRNRRPKALPYFNPGQTLTYEGQLNLIIENIKYIKGEINGTDSHE